MLPLPVPAGWSWVIESGTGVAEKEFDTELARVGTGLVWSGVGFGLLQGWLAGAQNV